MTNLPKDSSKLLRPTISLCCIAKNEEKNVVRFLDSFKDAVDEIIFVDTGSTDKTKELAQINGCKVYDFEWVNSFCKARNFAFSKATCDYIIWADLDDVLNGKQEFIQWRNYAMEFAETWFNTYNYALDSNGKPIVQFVRERVFKRSLNLQWQYDLHEGIILPANCSKDYAVSWTINHLRDQDDILADKSRNIKILEQIRSEKGLDSRMQFYYGKELYESSKPIEALAEFDRALEMDLQEHDRLLAYQYGAYSALIAVDMIPPDQAAQRAGLLDKAIKYCLGGIALQPSRAEFHVTAGDAYLKKGELIKALPFYGAAKKCLTQKDLGSPYEGAIYSFVDCYGLNPSLQIARILVHIGRLQDAKAEIKEVIEKYNSAEAKTMLEEVVRIESLTNLDNNQEQTDDIVFTTPPMTAYEFDENGYKTKPYGGSETALVCMAKHLKEKTGRNVIVYGMRENDIIAESGVEYRSNKGISEYFSKKRPKAHVAWRHNIEITRAKTWLWCHDLITGGVEGKKNFDKIMCLTAFHKNYVMAKQNVPEEMVHVTRNGITPEKLMFPRKTKNPNKLVWMSSPDRGLDRAMIVCDEIVKEFPDIELHVYNGFDNMYKYGLGAQADHLKALMATRHYVKFHGFTEQNKMYREVSDAVIWIHPCNFIETSCITAMEMLALGVFPITRRLGGLANTLREAEMKHEAILLDHDCITPKEIDGYVQAVRNVLKFKSWEDIRFDLDKHSWSAVADEWVEFMDLKPVGSKEVSA